MIEPDETFTLVLSAPVNATIAKEVATATITNDDTATPVTPGNYQGATQDGNYVFLTVLPNRTVTGFRINDLRELCGGPLRLIGGRDWSKSVYWITNDGHFGGEGSGSGSGVHGDIEYLNWYATFTGFFNTPTSVTGTINTGEEVNYKGQRYKCSTGEVRWSVTILP